MTSEQSKKLKVGDHVSFNGEKTDVGRVTAIGPAHVTIKWSDGHESFTGHRDMARVERAQSKS